MLFELKFYFPHRSQTARVKFKFEDSFVVEEENLVGYGFKDFVTDFGGLLGLFLGCSTMSLVEVFYHPIMNLWSQFTRNN